MLKIVLLMAESILLNLLEKLSFKLKLVSKVANYVSPHFRFDLLLALWASFFSRSTLSSIKAIIKAFSRIGKLAKKDGKMPCS